MLLFDYGHTLLAEPDWDFRRGAGALLACATKNPLGVGAGELAGLIQALWEKFLPVLRMDMNHHERQIMRLATETLRLEFLLSFDELEMIYWENTVEPVLLPHIQELLDFLAEANVRTGVVSNMTFSGAGLTKRIAKKIRHRFEFVIASSEYGVRKPDPMIFQLALAKADLPPADIWFCGDNPRCDVDAAYAAGMRPVWYTDNTLPCPFRDATQPEPTCPHLHIHDWRELMKILDLLGTSAKCDICGAPEASRPTDA